MAGRNTAVSGIYRLKNQAERALDTLIAGGLPCSSISVLLLDSARDAADPGGGGNGVIDGTIGILAGVSAVPIPGFGRAIAAGPIMAGLAGAMADSPVCDLLRALLGIGIPQFEAERYAADVREGGTLLSLSCNSIEQAARAKYLLTATGAGAAQATWRALKS